MSVHRDRKRPAMDPRDVAHMVFALLAAGLAALGVIWFGTWFGNQAIVVLFLIPAAIVFCWSLALGMWGAYASHQRRIERKIKATGVPPPSQDGDA